MSTLRTLGVTAVIGAALVIPAVAAVPASAAAAGRPEVTASGACTGGGGTWELKAKTEDGNRLEVEFEVDTNVAGQTFNVRIVDGASVVFAGQRTTAGRSGSFSVERLTTDDAGRDTIKARATRAGVVCAGTVRI